MLHVFVCRPWNNDVKDLKVRLFYILGGVIADVWDRPPQVTGRYSNLKDGLRFPTWEAGLRWVITQLEKDGAYVVGAEKFL